MEWYLSFERNIFSFLVVTRPYFLCSHTVLGEHTLYPRPSTYTRSRWIRDLYPSSWNKLSTFLVPQGKRVESSIYCAGFKQWIVWKCHYSRYCMDLSDLVLYQELLYSSFQKSFKSSISGPSPVTVNPSLWRGFCVSSLQWHPWVWLSTHHLTESPHLFSTSFRGHQISGKNWEATPSNGRILQVLYHISCTVQISKCSPRSRQDNTNLFLRFVKSLRFFHIRLEAKCIKINFPNCPKMKWIIYCLLSHPINIIIIKLICLTVLGQYIVLLTS